tara:strand:- start:247 stop:432 length:186 start_codon:yes stop_codon:yes gene_type:complete
MTNKLEELNAAREAAAMAAYAAADTAWAADVAADAAYAAAFEARDAYLAELKKTQKGQTND